MITFEIATPERIVYKDTVDSLTLPTREGEITILPQHIPLVAVLAPGAITVRKGQDEQYMAVSGGFIEVQPASGTDAHASVPHPRDFGSVAPAGSAGRPAQISPTEKLQSGRPATRVVVLADTAERAEELTIAAIEQARAEAERVLKEKRGADTESFTAAAATLERELARLKVARRHRTRSRAVS